MKKTLLFAVMLFCAAVWGQDRPAPLNIIPEPVKVERGEGAFTIDRNTKVYAADKEALKSARYFIDYFNRNFGYELSLVKKPKGEGVIVLSDAKNGGVSGGYALKVTPRKVFP